MKLPVIGTGHTKFGISSEDIGTLMLDACMQSLNNTNISIDEVDIIYISNFSSNFSNQCHLPALLASKLGQDKEITRIESACASGGLALKEAAIAISSGLYKTALVVGAEKMTGATTQDVMSTLASAASANEMKHGTTFPSLYALMAQRHFYEFGTTEEDLAMIAVNNHKNAMYNPLAQFHKEITVDDVLASSTIAAPLKLLDCSPISDGASAILLGSESMVPNLSNETIYLTGIGHDTDSIELYNRKSLTTMPAVRRAANKCFKMSGVTSKNIDVSEVHDCFTIAELIQLEDIGFCEKGMGKQLIEDGAIGIDGDIPINPSGGLKAKGHPIGATGVSQVVEIVKQLKGECGVRQVNDAEIGLCCNIGGSGSSAVVSMFSR